MDAIERFKRGSSFLAEKPMEFARDPESGRAALMFVSSFHVGGRTIETPMAWILIPEVARALLADLPELEVLLREATSGQTKPDVVQ
jgi:hypothetical protein